MHKNKYKNKYKNKEIEYIYGQFTLLILLLRWRKIKRITKFSHWIINKYKILSKKIIIREDTDTTSPEEVSDNKLLLTQDDSDTE